MRVYAGIRALQVYRLYALISYALIPWLLVRLLWSGLRDPRYFRRWQERFGIIPSRPGTQSLVWLHAVSVGEVQAAAPLVQRLLDDFSGYRILLTTMTPTGAEIVRRRFGDRVDHYYLPYDIPLAMAQFVSRLRPILLILLEAELWPNLLRTCRRRGVPVVLVNARMSQHSMAGYARFPALTRTMLSAVSMIAAQSRADADRFLGLGAADDRVRVTGNLKFDSNLPPDTRERGQSLRQLLGTARPVWIAASTHAGEDELVLSAHAGILTRLPDCLLMLAPRHPERCDRVEHLCRRRGLPIARHSRNGIMSPATLVYLIDSLGELPLCYAAADVAFVGGSLVPIGGHNLLEPAALGVPVISGPHCFKSADIVAALRENNAVRIVEDTRQLQEQVYTLLTDMKQRHQAASRGRAVVVQHGGVVDKLVPLLVAYLSSEPIRSTVKNQNY